MSSTLSGIYELKFENEKPHPMVYNLINGKSYVYDEENQKFIMDMKNPEDARLNGQMVYQTYKACFNKDDKYIINDFFKVVRCYDNYLFTLVKQGRSILMGNNDGEGYDSYRIEGATFMDLVAKLNLLSQAVYYLQTLK